MGQVVEAWEEKGEGECEEGGKKYQDLLSLERSAMANATHREQVFFSYSHKDRRWLERFQAMLKPLIQTNQLSVWDDTKIKSGHIWRDEIKKAIAAAKVAVLLVTTDFLNSNFIAEHELPPLLEAAQREGLTILLVVVDHNLFEETELGRYQAVNDPARPLTGISGAKRQKELVKICREIKSAVEAPIPPDVVRKVEAKHLVLDRLRDRGWDQASFHNLRAMTGNHDWDDAFFRTVVDAFSEVFGHRHFHPNLLPGLHVKRWDA